MAILLPVFVALGTSAQSQVFTPWDVPPTVIIGGTGQPPVVVDMEAVEEAARYDYSARRLMMPGAEKAYRSRLTLRQPNLASSPGATGPRTTPLRTANVRERRPAPAPALISASGRAPVGGGGHGTGEPDFAMVDDLLDILAEDGPRQTDVPAPSESEDAEFAAMFDTSPEVPAELQEEVVAAPRVDATEEPLVEPLSNRMAGQMAGQMADPTAPEPLMPSLSAEVVAVEDEMAGDEPAPPPEPILETVTALPEEITVEPAPRPEALPVAEAPTQMASLPSVTETVGVLRQIMVEFAPDSTELSGDMKSLLDSLGARLMKENTRVKLQAFAGNPGDATGASRRLSLKRALAVRSRLIGSGVRSTRIDVRANGIAGDDKPSERVDVTVTQ